MEHEHEEGGGRAFDNEQDSFSQRYDDLEAYRRLIRLNEELEDLSLRCWSTSSATALKAAAHLVRKLASALHLGAFGLRRGP